MNVFELFAKLKLDTDEYESGLDKAKSSAISKIGGGIASAAKLGAKAIGVATGAVTAIGATSVKVGMDFDKSMSQVYATMGDVNDMYANNNSEMDDLFQKAEQLGVQFDETTTATELAGKVLRAFAQEEGRTTAWSATQAADALNYMALAGYSAGKSVEMLPNVLALASAGSMDLARASDMVTDAQTAFGISNERVTQMVDEMAKAASTGNTSVEQLGDAFLIVGGLAQELRGGMVELDDGTVSTVDGLKELEIALTAMANAGIKGSEAGTHMRNMLLKLSSPTTEGTKALEAMGVSVFDAQGNMRSLQSIFSDLNSELGEMTQKDKINVISDLFNARDIASAEALLNAMGDDWNHIGESILNAEGAGEAMAKTQLDNLAGDITLFKSALEGAQIAMSDKLTPTIRQFVAFGTDGISRLTAAFTSQGGGIEAMMDEFGKLLSEGLTAITEKLPDMTKAGVKLIGSLGNGILDNVDIIVDAGISVIAELSTALVNGAPKVLDAALRIFETLLNTFDGNFDGIVAMAGELISGLAQAVTKHASKIATIAFNILKHIVESISQGLPEALSNITKLIRKNMPTFLASVLEIVHNVANLILENVPVIVSALANALPLIANAILDFAPTFIESILTLIPQILEALVGQLPVIINAITTIFNNVIQSIITLLPTLITVATQIIITLANALLDNLPAIINAAITLLKSLGQGLIENLPIILDAVLQISMALINGLLENAPAIIEAGITLFTSLVEDLPTILKTIVEKLPELIFGIVDALIEHLPDIVKAGVDLLVALVEGLPEIIIALGKAIGEIFIALKNGFEERWPAIKETGKQMFESFVNGFKDNVAKIANAVSEIWSKIKNAFSEKLEQARDWGKDMLDNFIQGIKDKVNAVGDAVKGVAEKIKGFLGFSEPDEGPLSNFHTYAPDMMELFMKGIKDNENKLQATVGHAFDFGGLINAPAAENDSAYNSGKGALRGVNNYTINVNQPVSTPADMLREIRTEAQYGLMIGEELA